MVAAGISRAGFLSLMLAGERPTCYAVRHAFYAENAPWEFFRAWQEASGRGEFVFISEHTLPNAHGVATDPPSGNVRRRTC